MKVGIVTENYFPTLGGIQEHVYHMKKHLTAHGVEVRVITGIPRTHERAGPSDAEVDVVRVGRAARYGTMGTFTHATMGPRAALGFATALRRERFDLLHVHSPCDPGLPMLAQVLYRGPRVATLHSYFPHRPFRSLAAPYYHHVLSHADAVLAVSPGTRDAMARYARFDCEVVPNGVDCAMWEGGRPRPDLQDGRRHILFVGRLEPRNGCDLLVDAFAAIARERPDVDLLIAGDGPQRAELEARAGERVRFLGAVYEERPDLYASSRLMVIPARAVGFSILVLEAFAASLPVVALPAPGVSQAGGHFRAAILADDNTPAGLARAILGALDADHTARVAEGRDIARAHDWSVVAARVLAIYRGVLEAWARKHGSS